MVTSPAGGGAVCRVQAWPAGHGAGSVLDRPVTSGVFDGKAKVFGSVESDHPPKWRSSAMKVPVIVSPSSTSLQSASGLPPAETRWMSIVGMNEGGPCGADLSCRFRYHGMWW